MDINKWTLFSLLDSSFIAKIRIVYVFGNLGNEAVIVTRDDEVFAMGSNTAGCLGVGDLHNALQPKKIEVLSGKQVIDISCGSGPHVLAVTRDGAIYSWGHNGYCELGNGSTKQSLVPTPVVFPICNVRIVKAACGSHHSLALTDTGEVYAWGQNNCGQVASGMTANQSAPRKVGGILSGKKVTDIAAGQTCSLAVMENGELYGWGYNGNGQLGVGSNQNQQNPIRVPLLENVIITRVECGYCHTLALTDLGHLYAWGANSYGQLGTGNKSNMGAPLLVAGEIGRIVDIAASHYNHISAAVTQTSCVFMWGQCRGQCVTLPTKTPFTSLHDVFACFATPSVMWRPMVVNEEESIEDNLKHAFDNSDSSDMTITVGGKSIHVHKALLKIRCQYFRTMFQDHWQEDSQSDLVITQYSHDVYRAFLQFLYTDTVHLPAENALELLDLANAYCETKLKKKCELIIKRGITIENAAMLYSTAIHYHSQELEDFCFKFSLNHMTELTQTSGFNSLDEHTVKDFIRKAARLGVFKS